MSVFNPGGGDLKSTNLPGAFFEMARNLDEAERNRNNANPGLLAQRKITTTINFGELISVAAEIPIVPQIRSDGSSGSVAQDYLGPLFNAFTPGTGDLKSSNLIAAFVEISEMLAAAEKAIPLDSQPNNIQIIFDRESGVSTITANLPFSTITDAAGRVTIAAIDYLP